jgi:hypothetical protein
MENKLSPEVSAFFEDAGVQTITSSNQDSPIVEYSPEESVYDYDTNAYPEYSSNNTNPLLNTNDDNNQISVNDDSVSEYNDILDFLQYRTGLLTLPEDFELTLDNVEEAVSISNDYKTSEILEHIKSRAGDEYVAELFDIVWEGGTLADIQFVKNTLDDEFDIDQMDLDNEDDQRLLISRWFYVSLNPNSPAYELQVKNIEPQVDKIIEQYTGKAYAEQAYGYYKELFEYQRQQKYNEIQQREHEQKEYERAVYQKKENWNKAFRYDLANNK